MGYFRRTIEENYLAALVTVLHNEARDMFERALASNDPAGSVAESLSRIVFIRMVGEHIRQYRPSWVANKWIRVMDREIRSQVRPRLWTIVTIHELDITKVIGEAQIRSHSLLIDIGSDRDLAFERYAPTFKEVRRRAVAAVNPDAEQWATDVLFEQMTSKE